MLVVAHAPLASALCGVAAHTYPGCGARLKGLDVHPEWDLERAITEVKACLPSDGPVLVFVDALGATPANAAGQALQGREGAALIYGVNVPMLWRSLCYGHESLDDVVAKALEGAVRGVGQA